LVNYTFFSNIIFGNSYAPIFNIYKKKKNFIYHINIKGSLVYTILQKNFIYYKILNICKQNKFDNAIFCYGISDLLYYYPKKKYIDNIDVLKNIYLEIEKFVIFIYNLPNIKNKYILGLLPIPIKIKEYKNFMMFHNYDINSNIYSKDAEKNFIDIENKIINYNKLLDKYCNSYKINFCNIYDNILKNNKIKDIYIMKYDPIDMHLNYEYLLLTFLKYTKLNFLLYYHNNNMNELLFELKNNYNKYLKKNLVKLNKMNLYDKYKFNYIKYKKISV